MSCPLRALERCLFIAAVVLILLFFMKSHFQRFVVI